VAVGLARLVPATLEAEELRQTAQEHRSARLADVECIDFSSKCCESPISRPRELDLLGTIAGFLEVQARSPARRGCPQSACVPRLSTPGKDVVVTVGRRS